MVAYGGGGSTGPKYTVVLHHISGTQPGHG